MRIPTAGQRSRLEMNMTPMIDVVFLLIIFFLVSSHLAKQEVQAEMNLPAAETGTEPKETGARRLTINVVSENGVYVVKLGSQPANPIELEARLKHELQNSLDDLEVRIRGDRAVPYHFVEPILVTCARLGIWNVNFAVVRTVDAP